MHDRTPSARLLTTVKVDGGSGKNTSVFEELLYKHVLNRYLAIGEKFPVKMLATGNPTATHAASISATSSSSAVHKHRHICVQQLSYLMMNDYVNNIEPENTKYSLFQLHPSSCTAMETEVEIMNFIPSFKGVSSFHLCSFDDEKEKNEFIVSGPGSLGIIVDANGVSHRAPLQLSPNIVGVFVWKNYFFTVTDEFFTIHNILTQSQIQTINLQKPSVACFSADAHLLYFTGTSDCNTDTTSIRNIQVLGPERWDLIARRFILTGCLKQAFLVQQQERNRLTQVMQLQVEKFKHEQQLFDKVNLQLDSVFL
ncbi:unnamed protein product [Schistosoma margrebowiei]|uniref:Uncharacterized protein n=1 Tax=Schistosoma margrebowiei TaxID=48269 RepID=A0A183MT39_9TREM|nr:unnamed protein product [Schistosoma margrebowiei]